MPLCHVRNEPVYVHMLLVWVCVCTRTNVSMSARVHMWAQVSCSLCVCAYCQCASMHGCFPYQKGPCHHPDGWQEPMPCAVWRNTCPYGCREEYALNKWEHKEYLEVPISVGPHWHKKGPVHEGVQRFPVPEQVLPVPVRAYTAVASTCAHMCSCRF